MLTPRNRRPRPAGTGSAHPAPDKYARPSNAKVSDRGTKAGRQCRLNPPRSDGNRELCPVHSTDWFGGDPRLYPETGPSEIHQLYLLGTANQLPRVNPFGCRGENLGHDRIRSQRSSVLS